MSRGPIHVRSAIAGGLVLVALLLVAPAASAIVTQSSPIDVSATAGTQFTGPVASFRSTDPNLGDFTATIDWGDGSPVTVGTIESLGVDLSESVYRVSGSHAYAAAGTFPVTVVISEVEQLPVVVNATATVAAAGSPQPPPPGPPDAPPPPPGAPPPPPPPIVSPTIVSAAFSPPPRAGRLTTLRIRALSDNAPVGGYRVNFGEGGLRFGAFACTTLPPVAGDTRSPFVPGTPVTFGLDYTFLRAGRHAMRLIVATGFCEGEKQTSQNFTVNVPPAGAGAAAAAAAASWPRLGQLTARAAQAACTDDVTIPSAADADVVAAAAVCLVNVERAREGLTALAVDARLLRSATAHAAEMVGSRFFAHQGPSEPELGARGAAAGYTGGMGENIGYGVDKLATASAMVDAWMNSPPHRANILDRRYRGIGMSVIPSAPTGPPTPGASYVTNFGTEDPGAAPAPAPAAATGPAPTIAVSLSPSSFPAASSGPPSSPTGAGARISYVLAKPANVVFTVQRRLAGRRSGRRCVAPRASNRRARSCTRTRRLGAFREQGAAGTNVLRFRGRIGGRRLAPGRYQLVAVATDATGSASRPRTLSFRITGGRR